MMKLSNIFERAFLTIDEIFGFKKKDEKKIMSKGETLFSDDLWICVNLIDDIMCNEHLSPKVESLYKQIQSAHSRQCKYERSLKEKKGNK